MYVGHTQPPLIGGTSLGWLGVNDKFSTIRLYEFILGCRNFKNYGLIKTKNVSE